MNTVHPRLSSVPPALSLVRLASTLRAVLLVACAVNYVGVPPTAAGEFAPPTEEQTLAALGPLDGETSTVRKLLTPDGDFEPIQPPVPPDWLAIHEEPGQPYGTFVYSDAQAVTETRRIIYLQPLGEFNADSAPSLEALRDYAAAFFQLDVVLLPADVYESAAFEPRINSGTKKPQLRSSAILEWLGERLPEDGYCIVAVTMSDLYPAPGWNFVYGQASPAHRSGVFSFVRHDPFFFGRERPDDFDTVMLRRSCKTLVHEIAHIFGLAHCIYYRCVENGVNHAAEDDSRPQHLCPVCLRKLRYATGADMVTRYRDLAYFYSQHAGWDDEEAWVRRQLAKLHSEPLKPRLVRPKPYLPDNSRPYHALPPAPEPAAPEKSRGPQELQVPPPSKDMLQPPASVPAQPSDPATPQIPTPMVPTEPMVALLR